MTINGAKKIISSANFQQALTSLTCKDHLLFLLILLHFIALSSNFATSALCQYFVESFRAFYRVVYFRALSLNLNFRHKIINSSFSTFEHFIEHFRTFYRAFPSFLLSNSEFLPILTFCGYFRVYTHFSMFIAKLF